MLSPLIFNPGQGKDVYPCFIWGEMGALINEMTEPASEWVEPVPTSTVLVRKPALPPRPGTHLGSRPSGE